MAARELLTETAESYWIEEAKMSLGFSIIP